MAKPTGKLVFDRDHPMLAGGLFHSGSTFSDYGEAMFHWETRGADKAGYMINGVWATDKGIESKNGQGREYGVIDTPPDYYTLQGALLFVYEHNGALVNNGIINHNDSATTAVRSVFQEKNNTIQIYAFNANEFFDTSSGVGVENAICFRISTPPASNNDFMTWRLYGDQMPYKVPSDRQITNSAAWTDITTQYFLNNPAFMHLLPNITLNMMCYIEGDFTHAQASDWITDPWQITKEGVIVPPSAGDSPIMLGTNF